MTGLKRLAVVASGVSVGCLLLVAAAAHGAQPRITMWGTPPQEKPHFGKSAEAVPPLPLPVTPQRRSEKKRPPAAPSLIANLANFSFDGWQGSPGAVDTLLRTAQQNVNLWYGWEHLDMAEIVRKHTAGVPVRTPILYLCAYYPLALTGDQREALRDYVLGGGTLLINCCGQDEAFASVQEEMKTMFPKRPLRLLPMDHPLYLANYRVEHVKMAALGPESPFTADLPEPGGADPGADAPHLRAVTLGTRAAVIVSREDLACGWNQWDNPRVPRYSPTDSNRLGINIITYVTAELKFAKFLSQTLDLKGPNVRPREQLVFAQVIHDGNWDPNPSGVPWLLKEAASNTSIAVRLERRQLELRSPDLFSYPLLYMTGTWDPKLRPDEVAILRRYLREGGTLMADAASGRSEFDLAFRRLAKDLFPDAALQKLPPGHPLFSTFYRVEKLAVNHEADPVAPAVEAVFLGDRPVILYSPLGLSDGWAREYSAFARCYTTEDAVRLATNMIVYAMQ